MEELSSESVMFVIQQRTKKQLLSVGTEAITKGQAVGIGQSIRSVNDVACKESSAR